VPSYAPPAFMIAGNIDACCSEPVIDLLQKYRKAHVSVEAHIIANTDHAFNMGYRSDLQSIKDWPHLLADWLTDNHILSPEKK
jgi:hypothetical protein